MKMCIGRHLESVVRGHQSVSTPVIGEILDSKIETGNSHDRYRLQLYSLVHRREINSQCSSP